MYTQLTSRIRFLVLVVFAIATIVGCNSSDVAENPIGESPVDPTQFDTPMGESLSAEMVKQLSQELQLTEDQIVKMSREFVTVDEAFRQTDALALHTGGAFPKPSSGAVLLAENPPRGCSWSRRISYGWTLDRDNGDWDVYTEFIYPKSAKREGYRVTRFLYDQLGGKRPLEDRTDLGNGNIKLWVLIGGGPFGEQEDKPADWIANFLAHSLKHFYCN